MTFRSWLIFFQPWQASREIGPSIRCVCLFLFSVPSQRWLIACFFCLVWVISTHVFLFWPSYVFISSFSLFAPSPPKSVAAVEKSLHASLSFSPLVSPPHHQLQLWDTAGQERFRKSMVQHYYRNVHAVLFIYDVTCPASFSGLASWVEECRQNSLGQEIPR